MGGYEERRAPERASGECDVFVTMDGNIEHQQDLANLPFGVVVIGAASKRNRLLARLNRAVAA